LKDKNMISNPTKRRPRGILRLLLRAPIWLYRSRLGWLMGKRFLMLSQTGRNSGQQHQGVLEVVFHSHESGAYYVAAGWRGKADWFKNIQVNPAVHLMIGVQTFDAVAHVVDPSEAADILLAYAHQHPLAFHELSRMMMGETLQAYPADCYRMAQSIPLVRLCHCKGLSDHANC
jgi:deazaflavin-dependent oxidoreductase (nitroreductase family)